MSDETSPAVKLRENVVLLVVRSIVVLTGLLYAEIGLLLIVATVRKLPLTTAVPSELWAAGALGFGYLTATLVNTKHDATVQDPAPVQVVNQADDPVPVDADPEPDPPVEDDAEEPEPEPVVKRRRAG